MICYLILTQALKFVGKMVVSPLILSAKCAFAVIDSSSQMQLGNPSGATADTNNFNHYLLVRSVEAIDYNNNLGEPNWVSWDLTSNDVGSVTRSTSFYTDTNLPPNFYRVTDNDYNGVGTNLFSRGHMCPSEDRTDTTNDNKAVFFMSNIVPQSQHSNSGVWGTFEDYCRTRDTNYELLIIAGPSGFGSRTIPSGKAYIPSNIWKIVVFVPAGSNTALSRITVTNRVVAISIPNVTNGLNSAWQTYVTSPQKIERDTGLKFFTALPDDIADVFRAEVDGTPYFTGNSYSNNQFCFTVNCWPAGTNFVVQATTNLTTWISLKTNVAPFQFIDTNALPQRFYRVQSLQ